MTEEHVQIHDIIIVGAGPCGLAVAARLRENTPSALFTDSEHQRYHWMRSTPTSRKTSKPIKATRRAHTVQDRLLSGPSLPITATSGPDIVVLDASSEKWMGAWDKKFKDLKISHLRSPMFFHPDPGDRDGLLGYAYKDGEPEKGELREIKGVIGKGLSKYQRKQKVKNAGKAQSQETVYLDERERHDYYRPSQRLFSSYCTDIIARYNLEALIQKSEVQHISFNDSNSIFTLTTSTGIKHARIVILATGATANPILPVDTPFTDAQGSVCHAFSPIGVISPYLASRVAAKNRTNIAVIGGGLTSAQITSLLISSGITHVHQFTRGPLKTKHFDVDLGWVGKYRNYHLATFWSADDDEERFEMIRDARGGGSVNPEYKGVLTDLIKKGKVHLHEHTTIMSATWDMPSSTWSIKTDNEDANEMLPKFDHVVYATGVNANIATVPFMQGIIRSRPLSMYGGLPTLTQDLMWDSECPVFITGRLAGLRLGPGAGNLEGARQGAERIAWKVSELLETFERNSVCLVDGQDDRTSRTQGWDKKRKESLDSGYESRRESDGDVDMRRLGLGGANQFGVLRLEHEDEEELSTE